MAMVTANKSLWAIYLSAGAFVVVATVAAYNIFSPFSRTHGFGDTPAGVLNRSGYLEIRPATNFGGPGTIVTVESKTDNFVMMHPTCNMDQTEVSSLWQSSPSVDTNVVSELSGEFKLGVDMLKRAGLSLHVDEINEIAMTFENTKVLVVSDESRLGLETKYLKGECLKAVLRITSIGKKCVTQPISALQADINYRVKFSDKTAASDKAKILDKVSGVFTTGGRTDANDSIIGKALFVGLKLDDAWCIVPNNGEPEKSVASLAMTQASVVDASSHAAPK